MQQSIPLLIFMPGDSSRRNMPVPSMGYNPTSDTVIAHKDVSQVGYKDITPAASTYDINVQRETKPTIDMETLPSIDDDYNAGRLMGDYYNLIITLLPHERYVAEHFYKLYVHTDTIVIDSGNKYNNAAVYARIAMFHVLYNTTILDTRTGHIQGDKVMRNIASFLKYIQNEITVVGA